MSGPGTVSVVIATRDRPQLVREAIAAALQQDYDDTVEVIVVFDQCAPDTSLERSEGSRSVRVIGNTRSPGLAGARNSGIEAASGEFVAFCDDDDYWLPGKLRAQVAALADEAGGGLCTSGIRVQYDGHVKDRVLEADRIHFADLLEDRHTELHPSTFLFRRSVLLTEIGLVDEQVPGGFGEDYELLLRSARRHPIVNLTTPMTVVRWGRQSYFFRRWETMAAGLTWLLARYPEFESSPRGSSRIQGQIAFAHAATGRRAAALHWAIRAWRRNPREPRIVLSVAVALRILRPGLLLRLLHRHGRSI